MKIAEQFKNKTLVITGGTGSFGSTVLQRFIASDIGEIRILSRDEKKQDWMRHTLQKQYPDHAGKVQFYLGDVRNLDSVRDVMFGAHYVLHAAALKEVPSCEFFPMEAVQTNIIGTDNVVTAAIENRVERLVFLSTDKAAYPINTMGMTKAVGEKVIQSRAQKAFERAGTVLSCTRYGNVMCSRGSVIPLFINQIKQKSPVTVTDPNMTRFLMNLDEAVELVAFAFEHAQPGDLFVQKACAATIGDLADGVMKIFGKTEKKIIGSRHGEKLYETLMTREECLRATDRGDYFRIVPDARGLNYDKYYIEGNVLTESVAEYTSHNTTRLNVDEIAEKLMTTDYVKEELEGRPHLVDA
ncbi:MAG: polysaccharide biosynthesis protein [Clostridia bacterium]|nr:polysaccharide biosynthesis protein [Clostridia bacterium]